MLYQGFDALYLVWLVVSIILFGLMLYLAIRWLISKSKAHDKLVMIFLCSFLCVFLVPIVAGAIGGLLVQVGALFSYNPNYMGLMTPILMYLMMLVVIKYLIDVPWDRAVWISLVSIFLLLLLLTIVPLIGQFSMIPV
jgi:hypothetical protein